MDFIDRLRELSTRIPRIRQDGLIKTEEGTKNALIMPFIAAMGYNVFDPSEVTPELVADVGTKKGEKVDYAILKDGKPIMLFECKALGSNLNEVHASQLYRYFSVTTARFGVLTDGVIYRFYSDLDEPNKMDASPFFTFDLSDFKDEVVDQLKRFTKTAFDETSIITIASEMKYKTLIRQHLGVQFQQPSDDLIRLLVQGSGAFTGRFTQIVLDNFRVIVRDTLKAFINEQVDNRLKSALATEQNKQTAEVEVAPTEAPPASAIQTTQDEVDGYLIIKAILRDQIDVKRVTMRDAQSYCAVLLDDNNRRPIARLYFTPTRKLIGIFDERREEHKHQIASLDEIFTLADSLRAAVARYEQPNPPQV